jgi:hypothetical protein
VKVYCINVKLGEDDSSAQKWKQVYTRAYDFGDAERRASASFPDWTIDSIHISGEFIEVE